MGKKIIDYKGIRNKYLLTQTEMAKVLGLSGQMRISEYERGVNEPSKQVKILYCLIDKYGIDIVRQFTERL